MSINKVEGSVVLQLAFSRNEPVESLVFETGKHGQGRFGCHVCVYWQIKLLDSPQKASGKANVRTLCDDFLFSSLLNMLMSDNDNCDISAERLFLKMGYVSLYVPL